MKRKLPLSDLNVLGPVLLPGSDAYIVIKCGFDFGDIPRSCRNFLETVCVVFCLKTAI